MVLGDRTAEIIGERMRLRNDSKATRTWEHDFTTSDLKKTMVQRKGPPSFDVVVVMESREAWTIYDDVAPAIDALLEGILTYLISREIIS